MTEDLNVMRDDGFSRIADRLELMWGSVECETYLNSLIIDHRGDRSGFPTTTMKALLRLHRKHTEDHKFEPKVDPWDRAR